MWADDKYIVYSAGLEPVDAGENMIATGHHNFEFAVRFDRHLIVKASLAM